MHPKNAISNLAWNILRDIQASVFANLAVFFATLQITYMITKNYYLRKRFNAVRAFIPEIIK
jgi:hypothetical protein